MSKRKNGNGQGSAKVFRFNLAGLVVLSLCVIAGSAFVTGRLVSARQTAAAKSGRNLAAPEERDASGSSRQGPWGELFLQDITLERPVEYLTEELKTVSPPVWTFHGKNLEQVKAFFTTNGLTQPEVEKALAPERVSPRGADTLFRPSDEFVLSLRPETRARLYGAMRGLDVNLHLESPSYYAKNQIELMNGDARVHPGDLALFKQLVYGNVARHFSDYETLMGRIPVLERRVAMAAALSRQSAVLAKLCVRPDADLDKVIQYWGHIPNVRFIDIVPLLQALKALPRGGTMSLLYLLPPFARERLNTFPSPPAPGEPIPDSCWSTFNFCNVNPDNRFLDLAECLRHIEQEYYPIARPAIYGDVLLFKNNNGQIRHSAVYLADDLVFTKTGKSYQTPWAIMHMADLEAIFSNCKTFCVRIKTD